MEELERRGKNIRMKVWEEFMPEDAALLPKAQRLKIEEWCNEVPVVGFKSGAYDLNLIREHFAEQLAGTTAKISDEKRQEDHVSAHKGLPFPRHYQLPRPRNQL